MHAYELQRWRGRIVRYAVGFANRLPLSSLVLLPLLCLSRHLELRRGLEHSVRIRGTDGRFKPLSSERRGKITCFERFHPDMHVAGDMNVAGSRPEASAENLRSRNTRTSIHKQAPSTHERHPACTLRHSTQHRPPLHGHTPHPHTGRRALLSTTLSLRRAHIQQQPSKQ